MTLLALQFGVQPILTRHYTSPGITRSTVVLMQEVVKFVIGYTMLTLNGSFAEALQGTRTNSSSWCRRYSLPFADALYSGVRSICLVCKKTGPFTVGGQLP